jgi:hypothetical protein
MAETPSKKLFTADFEVHASTKMLYPYIYTASGHLPQGDGLF